MKTFFLVGSLGAGAAITAGSFEAARLMWIILIVTGLAWLWFRKPKHVEKAAVPTEYSEVEIREIFSALTAAKKTAPFRRIRADQDSPHDRYEELG